MPRVHFKSPLEDLTVEVAEGTSILEAAEHCGAHVGHSCGGVCACSTCHVYVKVGGESLTEQQDEEIDRLDQAFDVRPTSRLGCQAEVGKADVDVTISEESLIAWFDENPAARKEFEAKGLWPLKK